MALDGLDKRALDRWLTRSDDDGRDDDTDDQDRDDYTADDEDCNNDVLCAICAQPSTRVPNIFGQLITMHYDCEYDDDHEFVSVADVDALADDENEVDPLSFVYGLSAVVDEPDYDCPDVWYSEQAVEDAQEHTRTADCPECKRS